MKKIIFIAFACISILSACTEKDLTVKNDLGTGTDVSGEWIKVYSASDAEPNVNIIMDFWSIVPLIRFVPCIDNCGFDKNNSTFGRVDFTFNEGMAMKDSFGAYVDTIINNPISWSGEAAPQTFHCRVENGKITTIIESKNLNVYEHKILKFDGENLWIDWANAGIGYYVKRK